MAIQNAVLIVGPFQNLVVIDVIYFISAVRLHITEPDLRRPFHVPLGAAGRVAMGIPAILMLLFTICVNAVKRSAEPRDFDGCDILRPDAA
jgi:hypothetical protein